MLSPARTRTGLLLGVAAIAAAAAPSIAAAIFGWRVQSEFYPPVVGLGDSFVVYFPTPLNSLEGSWNGTATCETTGLSPLGEFTSFPAETRKDRWGSQISGKYLGNRNATMWAEVHVPVRAELAHNSFDLSFSTSVTYPLWVEKGGFENRSTWFSHSGNLYLAGAGAGKIYYAVWFFGQLAAGGLLFASWAAYSAACSELRAARSKSHILPEEEQEEAFEGPTGGDQPFSFGDPDAD